jgi:hypothetical protein
LGPLPSRNQSRIGTSSGWGQAPIVVAHGS